MPCCLYITAASRPSHQRSSAWVIHHPSNINPPSSVGVETLSQDPQPLHHCCIRAHPCRRLGLGDAPDEPGRRVDVGEGAEAILVVVGLHGVGHLLSPPHHELHTRKSAGKQLHLRHEPRPCLHARLLQRTHASVTGHTRIVSTTAAALLRCPLPFLSSSRGRPLLLLPLLLLALLFSLHLPLGQRLCCSCCHRSGTCTRCSLLH
mmetsp:Transcript_1333/g.3032  ORF Transcript_1333/g.3032 Transcript_1333/m.3032 type:complete len:205 (-) Transcript_1333:110-724(-)